MSDVVIFVDEFVKGLLSSVVDKPDDLVGVKIGFTDSATFEVTYPELEDDDFQLVFKIKYDDEEVTCELYVEGDGLSPTHLMMELERKEALIQSLRLQLMQLQDKISRTDRQFSPSPQTSMRSRDAARQALTSSRLKSFAERVDPHRDVVFISRKNSFDELRPLSMQRNRFTPSVAELDAYPEVDSLTHKAKDAGITPTVPELDLTRPELAQKSSLKTDGEMLEVSAGSQGDLGLLGLYPTISYESFDLPCLFRTHQDRPKTKGNSSLRPRILKRRLISRPAKKSPGRTKEGQRHKANKSLPPVRHGSAKQLHKEVSPRQRTAQAKPSQREESPRQQTVKTAQAKLREDSPRQRTAPAKPSQSEVSPSQQSARTASAKPVQKELVPSLQSARTTLVRPPHKEVSLSQQASRTAPPKPTKRESTPRQQAVRTAPPKPLHREDSPRGMRTAPSKPSQKDPRELSPQHHPTRTAPAKLTSKEVSPRSHATRPTPAKPSHREAPPQQQGPPPPLAASCILTEADFQVKKRVNTAELPSKMMRPRPPPKSHTMIQMRRPKQHRQEVIEDLIYSHEFDNADKWKQVLDTLRDQPTLLSKLLEPSGAASLLRQELGNSLKMPVSPPAPPSKPLLRLPMQGAQYYSSPRESLEKSLQYFASASSEQISSDLQAESSEASQEVVVDWSDSVLDSYVSAGFLEFNWEDDPSVFTEDEVRKVLQAFLKKDFDLQEHEHLYRKAIATLDRVAFELLLDANFDYSLSQEGFVQLLRDLKQLLEARSLTAVILKKIHQREDLAELTDRASNSLDKELLALISSWTNALPYGELRYRGGSYADKIKEP
jgi:hypothetical protein